uniref:Uncharacterized protein n=1 Tax=Triticum urartu TaxID=4572 RepID=A0A8R7QC10_TRIUA
MWNLDAFFTLMLKSSVGFEWVFA